MFLGEGLSCPFFLHEGAPIRVFERGTACSIIYTVQSLAQPFGVQSRVTPPGLSERRNVAWVNIHSLRVASGHKRNLIIYLRE